LHLLHFKVVSMHIILLVRVASSALKILMSHGILYLQRCDAIANFEPCPALHM